jgi:thioredoxin 1
VIKIDVDKNQALANQYKVRGVPTLILFWKGQILWQQSGLMTKRDLAAKINGALNRSYA